MTCLAMPERSHWPSPWGALAKVRISSPTERRLRSLMCLVQATGRILTHVAQIRAKRPRAQPNSPRRFPIYSSPDAHSGNARTRPRFRRSHGCSCRSGSRPPSPGRDCVCLSSLQGRARHEKAPPGPKEGNRDSDCAPCAQAERQGPGRSPASGTVPRCSAGAGAGRARPGEKGGSGEGRGRGRQAGLVASVEREALS